MIEVKDLHKSFGDTEVLKGISTTFDTGKTNLIIGQSGSGKTVFMKCLLGLLTPDSGTISYNGQIYSELSHSAQRDLRQEMGMLFQGSALFDSMTVEGNVMFPLEMFTNQARSEMQDRVDFVLRRVNLVDAHKKFPSEISGGMQKRVGIARAIVMNPKYLFCDEPNSGLDPKTAILIDNLIQEITQEYNITTVINTHDMNSVMEIGDNVILLYNGEIAWRGNRDEVLHSENETLHDFMFASPFLQQLRDSALHK
jgi:phospholipid/cholesterol/gamma-HCH transport system ATP-binding protein